jgi:hypothetical protein
MGAFSIITIAFRDKDERDRIAVFDSRSRNIQAIFLNGGEREFVITRKGETTPIDLDGPESRLRPDGVDLVPQAARDEGPGEVCYLDNGVLKCWSPS